MDIRISYSSNVCVCVCIYIFLSRFLFPYLPLSVSGGVEYAKDKVKDPVSYMSAM